MPIAAGFAIGDNIITVTYDRPVEPVGPLNAGNFTVSDVGGPRVVLSALIQLGGTVQVTLQGPPTGGAPGLISWSPPPVDIFDVDGFGAEPFVDFPVA